MTSDKIDAWLNSLSWHGIVPLIVALMCVAAAVAWVLVSAVAGVLLWLK